ncbi:NF-kappa-B inhibitor cactus [Lucilia cuprina]|uniref:NF-kappa-B inhibitor cactus n=1 Tax=Lucilia cuprina TaxID=7375 RepID=UPI001F0679E8|nr:NF-kappa-B inhibitor cactus [Lucilia cuprina]
MWNPTPSSSTATSSDNKQNIKEVVEVDDCKCSGVEQLDQQHQQQQKTNSKQQTSTTFGGQLTGSTNIQQQQQRHNRDDLDVEEEGDDKRKFSDLAGETTDSGFISGPQTSSSALLDTDNEEAGVARGGGDIKKLNIPESLSEPQQQQHPTHKTQQPNLDSGIIEEEEYDDDVCDSVGQKQQQQQQKTTNEPKMILPHSVESGISEWFCNLSLHNNPNAANNVNTPSTASNSRTNAVSGLNNLDAPKQTRSAQQTKLSSSSVSSTSSSYAAGSTAQQQYQQQQQTATIPQQITPANAWEKYYQQNDDGDTPLHLACISGYVDVVAALIRMAPHPCLFNIQNDEAQTPLHLATLTAQPKIIRMLLIAGAEPTARDRHGNTALHLACRSGEEQCVRALTIPISASEVNEAHRQYGHRANDKSYLKYAQLPSDLEIRNYDGERCVHLAAQAGFINILRILVLYGADINAREGKSGRTPLHIAIECCNEDLANYLLDDCQKLNLETATYAGLTAYQVACILNKSEMQNILEKRGAEPLTPPDSDYDSSDMEDLDDSKLYDRFGDPGYFVGYKGGNAMTVA